MNISKPLSKTDFHVHLWRERLKKGINFTCNNQEIFFVRAMTEDDVSSLTHLEKKIFANPWPYEAFRAELQFKERSIAFVGFVEQRLMAYSLSLHILDELYIHNLAVDPDFRRKGYGQTMLWLILEIAEYEQINSCHLEVRQSNSPAISLYEKFGFKIVGTRKHYYQQENEDAILMMRTLRR